jgi:hypothetical protein
MEWIFKKLKRKKENPESIVTQTQTLIYWIIPQKDKRHLSTSQISIIVLTFQKPNKDYKNSIKAFKISMNTIKEDLRLE